MASDNTPIKFIGKYEIIEEIGKGGMGVVYKGVDPYIERTLAIKTIRFDISNDEADYKKWKKRFLREAKLAGNLAHPNIVTIYDAGEDSGLFYIAMEYIEGKSLRDTIRSSKKIGFEDVQHMMEQICDALSYASKKGVIHCDIKPENILLDKEGKIYLVDFGIARTSSADLTKTMLSMVTPSYTSPERLNGQEPDIRSDVFALGAVLYEIVSGKKAFHGDTVQTIMKSILYDTPRKLDTISPDMPKEIHYIINRALAKDPEDRYQNYDEFYHDLKNYKDLNPNESFESDYNPDDMTVLLSGKKKFRWGKPIAILTGILIVLAVLFMFDKSNKPSIVSIGGTGKETIDTGRKYIDQKNYAKAIKNLKKVVASDPKDFNAYYLLGVAYQKKGLLDESIHSYKKAIDINQSFAPSYIGLAEVYEEKGDREEAISANETYLQLFPDETNTDRIKKKLAVLKKESEPDAEEAATTDTVEVTKTEDEGDPTASTENAYEKGKRLFENQQYDEAIVMFQEALKNDPDNEDIQRFFKLASHEKKKREDIALNRSLGVKTYENKNYFQAAVYFNEILNLDPENQEAKKYLALIRQGIIEENIKDITHPDMIRQRPFYKRTVRMLALDSGQADAFEGIYAAAAETLNRRLQASVNDEQRSQALQSFSKQVYSSLRKLLRKNQLVKLDNLITVRKGRKAQLMGSVKMETKSKATDTSASASTVEGGTTAGEDGSSVKEQPGASGEDKDVRTDVPESTSASDEKKETMPDGAADSTAEETAGNADEPEDVSKETDAVKSDETQPVSNEKRNISESISLGIQAYTDKNYDQAASYFNEVLMVDPDNPEAKKYLEYIKQARTEVMNEQPAGDAKEETSNTGSGSTPEGM